MAANKPAVDFTAIINADRQRRKNEIAAQQIFGKARRQSAPGRGNNRTPAAGSAPSLASRVGPVGVTKRTATTLLKSGRAATKPISGKVNADWTHDLHSLNNPYAKASKLPSRGPKVSRISRDERFHDALNSSNSSPPLHSQFDVMENLTQRRNISIRGLAGPYTVIVKNLAVGTSVADVESAMAPVGGVLLSCRLVAERPKVIAELIFETKEGAENVVETFNNQNADGNVLIVYQKYGGIPPSVKLTTSTQAGRKLIPLGPKADLAVGSDDSRDVGTGRYMPRNGRRDLFRERERENVVDGLVGFNDRMETDHYDDGNRGRGLYSDRMLAGNQQHASW